MEDFLNELVGFGIITLVVLMLAYLTKKKEEQFKQQDKENND